MIKSLNASRKPLGRPGAGLAGASGSRQSLRTSPAPRRPAAPASAWLAQRETDRVLGKFVLPPAPVVQEPAPPPGPGVAPAAGPSARAAPLPMAPEMALPPAAPTGAAPAPPTWQGLRLALILVAVLAVVAVCTSLVSSELLLSRAARTEVSVQRVDRTLDSVQTHMQGFERDVGASLRGMQAHLAELHHPPTSFVTAEDAFAGRRWADAEASYALYATENPAGRVLDIAWYKAAVASAMLNDCALSAAYAARLVARFPGSAYGGQARTVAQACGAAVRAQR